MKIEKLTDQQIRCLISADDLLSRSIRIGELFYGSEKAKTLFNEVLSEAEREFNFDTADIPLVVEAMPMADGTVVILITKMDDPEELDNRFSRFSSLFENGEDYADRDSEREDVLASFADEILKAMQSIRFSEDSAAENAEEAKGSSESSRFCKIYRFGNLDEVSAAGRAVASLYDGPNTLYKDPESNPYLLVVHPASKDASLFNRVCNHLSEYATDVRSNSGTAAYYSEHYPVLLKDKALQEMKEL